MELSHFLTSGRDSAFSRVCTESFHLRHGSARFLPAEALWCPRLTDYGTSQFYTTLQSEFFYSRNSSEFFFFHSVKTFFVLAGMMSA